jgi:hypothetical protein
LIVMIMISAQLIHVMLNLTFASTLTLIAVMVMNVL